MKIKNYTVEYKLDGFTYYMPYQIISKNDRDISDIEIIELVKAYLPARAQPIFILEINKDLSLSEIKQIMKSDSVPRGTVVRTVFIDHELFIEYLNEAMQGNFT